MILGLNICNLLCHKQRVLIQRLNGYQFTAIFHKNMFVVEISLT